MKVLCKKVIGEYVNSYGDVRYTDLNKYLTKGKVYEAKRHSNGYKLVTDLGKERYFNGQYFEEVPNMNYVVLDGVKLELSEETAKEWKKKLLPDKTIYNLKEGDTYYCINSMGEIFKRDVPVAQEVINPNYPNRLEYGNVFLTEKEAKVALDEMKFISKWKKSFHESGFDPKDKIVYYLTVRGNMVVVDECLYHGNGYLKPWMTFPTKDSASRFKMMNNVSVNKFFGVE